ncbi:MAG: IPT/TIG domain-containing protein, partial [Proteobacteria bacterium]|nr:IPT/TIG domain-containing protein [Pseudomonadota bacterium]
VTITGTNLSGATAVQFGATNAASFTVNSATSITAVAPAGSAGAVDVTVTTAGGTSATSAADQYTYVAAPTAGAINPTSGPTAGGTSVTVTGTDFVAGTTTVTIGGTTIPSGSVTVNSSTSLTLTTPAHASGNVAVTVTTSGGTSAPVPGGYTYAAAPTISLLSPNSGGTAGGTSVTITGTNLAGASSVTFDGLTAAIGSNTATQVVVTSPAHALGAVDVVVTTPGGTATAVGAFTYVNPPVANNDSYATVGNTALVVGAAAPATPYVSAAGSLLGNDTGTGTLTIALAQAPASGTITNLNSTTGTFTYTPNAGFTGTDTFKYTITDASTLTSAPATVTISVSGRVVYVNGAAGTNGSGISSSPFNTLAGVAAASGDTIFVESAGAPTATSGAISLGAGVILWGQGTNLPAIGGMAIANTSATSKPKLTGAVTLAGNNITVSSLDVDTSATPGTTALTNTGAISGALIQNNVALKSAGAAAVNLNNASGNFTLLSVSASSTGTGSGIVLNNLGGTGFTITGDGSTAGSGGAISGACSGSPTGCAAITPTNAGTVSLNFMTLSGPTGSGVYATNTSLTVANSTLSNFAVIGVFVQTSGTTVGTFNVHDNTINGASGDAVQLQHNSSGTWTGHIKTNAIGTLATAKSGSTTGDGIGIDVFGTGKGVVDVSSNTILNIGAGKGISATASSASATLHVSLLSNTVKMVQISSQDGMTVGSAGTVCLNATGNTSVAAGTAIGTSLYDMTGLSVLQNTTNSVFQIQGYGGSATNDAAVQTYLATNPGAPNNVLSGPAGPAIADHTSLGNINGFGTGTCNVAP